MKRSKTKKSTKIHARLKRRSNKPWRFGGRKKASASTATRSAATKLGTSLTALAEVATSLPLSTVGPQPSATDGRLERQGPKIASDAMIGSTDAPRAAGINLGPKPNPLTRPEVEGFLRGWRLALSALAIRGLIKREAQAEISRSGLEIAKELYPDWDPPPPPTKARSHAI